MDNSEAKRIEGLLEAYTTAHQCSWPEAMKKTGLPDPALMDTDALMSLESGPNNTTAHLTSSDSDVAIDGIINSIKNKLRSGGLSKR